MISKQKLKNTLVCYWSSEDESFIAESSLMPAVMIGTGDSEQEALESFESALNSSYKEIEADNVAGYKMGRPAKGYVAFNTNIRPASRTKISKLAEEMDISQGEVIDYLVFYRDCKLQEGARVPEKDELVVTLAELKHSMSAKLDQLIGKSDEHARTLVAHYESSKTHLDGLTAALRDMQQAAAVNIVVIGNQTAPPRTDVIGTMVPNIMNAYNPLQLGWTAQLRERMAAI